MAGQGVAGLATQAGGEQGYRRAASAVPEAGFGGDFTASVSELLRRAGASILISTYQSGHVIVARAEPDGGLNTHFRTFSVPMGMAVAGNRIAIGTKDRVITYLDHPHPASTLAPPGRHDGCFIPLSSHVTGTLPAVVKVIKQGRLAR